MMRVDFLRLIYIDPLKTGSQSLDRYWKSFFGSYLTYNSELDKHRRHITEHRYKNYRLCASVRNPYTRAYSLWNMDRHKKIQPLKVRIDNFKDYMEDVINLCAKYPNSDDLAIYRYYSCSEYLKPFDIADNNIIHMENMKDDLKNMGFDVTRITIRNKGTYDNSWDEIKTPELIEMINQWAGADFELYGYERL